MQPQKIYAAVAVAVAVEKAWELWTTPSDIMQWNKPSDDWHTPYAEADLRERGVFLFRMETKDGSFGFDHAGTYDKISTHELIEYTQPDGRKSTVAFRADQNGTHLTETFDPDLQMPAEAQRDFCQSVLNSFKAYAEHAAAAGDL